MKTRRRIALLIALMSIALLGLILIQYLWISSAVRLSGDEFDQRVYTALRQTADNMQLKQGVNFLAECMQADTVLTEEIHGPDKGFMNFIINSRKTNNDTTEEVSLVINTKEEGEHKMLISTTKRKGGKEVRIETGLPALPAPPTPPLAMATVALPPPPPVAATPTLKTEKKQLFYSFIKDAADEYAASHLSLQDLLDSALLIRMAQKQFAAQHLPDDYHLAIYEEDNDSIWLANKGGYKNPEEYNYKATLLNAGLTENRWMLAADFPSRNKYILASVTGMLLLSLLFTAIMVLVFVLAIRLILRQKKVNEITHDFISNMTHEFKTPLATISMTADTLKLVNANGEQPVLSEYAGMIKEEAQKLARHVDRILEVAATERDKGNCTEVVDLNAAIEMQVAQYRTVAEQRGGTVTTSVTAPLQVWAQLPELGYVVGNLLDNAIKYTEGAPLVVVEAKEQGTAILIAVRDKGLGISKSDQEHVFDKFYRVHTGNRHDVKGFGLGLNFVKNTVEGWGGRVWVESELNEGSTFYIALKKA